MYLVFLSVLVFGVAALLIPGELHYDVQLFLYSAKPLFDGTHVLYKDIIDLNSPLIFYLNFPALYLSNLLNIPPIKALTYFAIGLLVPFLFRYFSYIGVLFAHFSTTKKYLLFVSLCGAFFFAGNALFQRDYIIALFAWGYFLLRLIANTEYIKAYKYDAVFIGFCLGAVILIKPQYIVVPLGLEACFIIMQKSLRSIRNLPLLGLVLGSGALLFIYVVFFPQYFTMLHYAAAYYPHYKVAPSYIWLSLSVFIIGPGVFTYKYMITSTYRYHLKLFSIFLVLALLSGVLQGKGFGHHYFLFASIYLVYLVYMLMGLGFMHDKKISNVIILRYIVLLFLLPISGISGYFYINLKGYTAPIQSVNTPQFSYITDLITKYAKGSSYGVLFTGLYPFSTQTYHANVPNAFRYFNFWMLPGIYKDADHTKHPFDYHAPFQTPSQMPPFEEQVFNNIVSDFITNKPGILFVSSEKSEYGFGVSTFDYLEYFSQDPNFAEELKNYAYLETVYGQFDVYVRKERLHAY